MARVHRSELTPAVAFPLGGIGTGNVSIGSRGEWRDWEIWGEAAKGKSLPFTFWAIRVATADAVHTKVLEAPRLPPYDESHGFHPDTAAGLPHVERAELRGEYPFVEVAFADDALPVDVRLEAFTPLVPLHADDSGIPCAVLTHTVTNTGAVPVDLTLAGSLVNPVGGITRGAFGDHLARSARGNVNEFRTGDDGHGLFLRSDAHTPGDRTHGSMALVSTHGDVTYKRAWRRGAWFDHLREFWRDLASDGRLDDLGYDDPAPDGTTDVGSLGVVDTIGPGETRTYRWVLAWHFPYRAPGWGGVGVRDGSYDGSEPARAHYAVRYGDAWAVALDVLARLPELEDASRAFHAAFADSSLPEPVVDAVTANVVPLRSPTCFRLDDGRLHGWEGSCDSGGSCEGTCTHVWSYAYTVAYLFPELERGVRRAELTVETLDDGWMAFRAHRTFGHDFTWPDGNRPQAAIDGQCGTVVRTYREWLLGGDEDWLRELWPGLRRATDYALRHWDTDGDGVPDGRQHVTYDIELYGPNPLGAISLLAALRAASRLAEALGEEDAAARYLAAFERAAPRTDALLWNGEYFVQRLDDVDAYPYQHGLGCLSDQLLGQLHASLLGLGHLLPPEHVRSAIAAVYRHNFRRGFADHVNAQRAYVLGDEAGLLMCSWPDGGEPAYPFVYSDEVWTGTEYQVAAHLLVEGSTDEAVAMVAAVRDRHDGVRRNPWDEVECGRHYVRSMASFALLLAATGFRCDLHEGVLSFAPTLLDGDTFAAPFFAGRGWGVYRQRRAADGTWEPEVQVLGGDLTGLRVRACDREWTL